MLTKLVGFEQVRVDDEGGWITHNEDVPKPPLN
jgi:hypothetical protein